MASAVPAAPLGFISFLWLAEIWNCPSTIAVMLSLVLIVSFSMFASFTTGLLFLPDYKRFSG